MNVRAFSPEELAIIDKKTLTEKNNFLKNLKISELLDEPLDSKTSSQTTTPSISRST